MKTLVTVIIFMAIFTIATACGGGGSDPIRPSEVPPHWDWCPDDVAQYYGPVDCGPIPAPGGGLWWAPIACEYCHGVAW